MISIIGRFILAGVVIVSIFVAILIYRGKMIEKRSVFVKIIALLPVKLYFAISEFLDEIGTPVNEDKAVLNRLTDSLIKSLKKNSAKDFEGDSLELIKNTLDKVKLDVFELISKEELISITQMQSYVREKMYEIGNQVKNKAN
jgi:hypothetical protein